MWPPEANCSYLILNIIIENGYSVNNIDVNIRREGRSVAARSKLLGLHSPVLASLLGDARFATFYKNIFSLVICLFD